MLGRAGKRATQLSFGVRQIGKSMKKESKWKCPDCGRKFLRHKQTHSCGKYQISEHFRGKSDKSKELFNAFKHTVEEHCHATVYAQKTGIIFQLKLRFALTVNRNNWINVALCLWKPRKHHTMKRIEYFGGRCHRHWFRISSCSDIDAAFKNLVKESIEVGSDCLTRRCS